MNRLLACAVLGTTLAAPSLARACPDCASTIAARAALWDDPSFAFHLGATTAPFVVLGALVLALHRLGTSSSSGDR